MEFAETVFTMEVAPQVPGWRNDTPAGDHSYDVRLSRVTSSVRVQVKLQRRMRGEPLMRARTRGGEKTHYIVEVQRTRGGERNGVLTRPYRYSEFDLLAVCMQPSTGNWHDFLYTSIWSLAPRPGGAAIGVPGKDDIIETMQLVPGFPAVGDPHWVADLGLALKRLSASP